MNKFVLALTISLFGMFLSPNASFGQSRLIHYWHCNNAATPGAMSVPGTIRFHADYSIIDTSRAVITYQEVPTTSVYYATYLDFYVVAATENDTANLRMGASSGNGFKARNPSDSMELRFYIPTTHYKNIVFKYGCARSTNGATTHSYDYSIDSGTTWRTSGLSMTSDTINFGTFTVHSESLTDTLVNNNPRLVFRIKCTGGGYTTTSGNDRFDNVTVDGDTSIICSTPFAGTITGSSVMCLGSSSTFTTTGSGGAWSHTGSATSLSGSTVTAISVGIDTIRYTVSNACGGRSVASYVVNVSNTSSAGVLTGSYSVCQGASTVYTSTVSGGSWSTSAPSIASVNSATGTVYGVNGGTAVITYQTATSCGSAFTTQNITINPLPTIGSIYCRTATFCQGSHATLIESAAGGYWISASPGVATVDSNTGIATGVSGGTATISYVVSNSCATLAATYTLTILPSANAGSISGIDSLCIGNTTALSSSVTGGNWSSDVPSVAFVSATGVVTGFSAGYDSIAYTVTNSCSTAVTKFGFKVLTTAQCAALATPNAFVATSDMLVYPNPASGEINIEMPTATGTTNIHIMDIYGKTCMTRSVDQNGLKIALNLSGLAAGTYLVVANNNGNTYKQTIAIR